MQQENDRYVYTELEASILESIQRVGGNLWFPVVERKVLGLDANNALDHEIHAAIVGLIRKGKLVQPRCSISARVLFMCRSRSPELLARFYDTYRGQSVCLQRMRR